MMIICEGYKTCLNDCRCKVAVDSYNCKTVDDDQHRWDDPSGCCHNNHSDGKFRECGIVAYVDQEDPMDKVSTEEILYRLQNPNTDESKILYVEYMGSHGSYYEPLKFTGKIKYKTNEYFKNRLFIQHKRSIFKHWIMENNIHLFYKRECGEEIIIRSQNDNKKIN